MPSYNGHVLVTADPGNETAAITGGCRSLISKAYLVGPLGVEPSTNGL